MTAHPCLFAHLSALFSLRWSEFSPPLCYYSLREAFIIFRRDFFLLPVTDTSSHPLCFFRIDGNPFAEKLTDFLASIGNPPAQLVLRTAATFLQERGCLSFVPVPTLLFDWTQREDDLPFPSLPFPWLACTAPCKFIWSSEEISRR